MQHSILELSAPSLRYAVEMCEANPDYSAAVITTSFADIIYAGDIITDYADMTQYTISDENDVVTWRNGSSIRFVYPYDTRHRYNFTLMLLSPSLDEKERKHVSKWLR